MPRSSHLVRVRTAEDRKTIESEVTETGHTPTWFRLLPRIGTCLIAVCDDEQSASSQAAMLGGHKPCGSFGEFPWPTKSRMHACAHVTNARPRACNARWPASRRPTRNPWRAVSLWIWTAPIFVGLPQRRSSGAANKCKPSAYSARTRAAAAQRSAASTAWITASVAPRRANAAKPPALQWLTEYTFRCGETEPRPGKAGPHPCGQLKGGSPSRRKSIP